MNNTTREEDEDAEVVNGDERVSIGTDSDSDTADEESMMATVTERASRIPIRKHPTCRRPNCEIGFLKRAGDSCSRAVRHRQRRLSERDISEHQLRLSTTRSIESSLNGILHVSCHSTCSPATSTMSSTSISTSDSSQSADSRISNPSLHFEKDPTALVLPPNFDPQFKRMSISPNYPFPVATFTLSLSAIAEHFIIAHICGRSWIAGWSEFMNRKFNGDLNIGDEIIELDGHPLNGRLQTLLYRIAIPGHPLKLTIRKQPNATYVKLVKPIAANKDIGIVLHKGKNRIESIDEDSIAFRRGVPATMSAYTAPAIQVPTVITELNHARLHLFSKSSQLFRRLMYIKDGSQFTLTLQPYDFVKALKKEMKMHRHFRALCGPD